jgi:hypothetical protein
VIKLDVGLGLVDEVAGPASAREQRPRRGVRGRWCSTASVSKKTTLAISTMR